MLELEYNSRDSIMELIMTLEVNCLVRDPLGVWFVAHRENSMIAPQHRYQNSGTQQMGIWSKTAEFGKRFFTGSLGSAIPLSLPVAYQYFRNAAPLTQPTMVVLGLSTLALGLASAAVTSKPSYAFNRGIQFGLVAQITATLTGIGSEDVLKSISDSNITGAYNEWISTPCGNLVTRISSAWAAFWAASPPISPSV